ncbi:hypothetical protein BBF96_09580 [Anoxybacter fermentans]|uniref:HAD family hydrolase n=1 Tax=Anoxybacter fermentans TaxID=1323375 RepID=A0A3Q9HRD8_9FIRM|nr:YqeG family HAD IIIA-type phosphatase [Anoxybacter fermentans]AZR73617.1 hypothetical protein BBF96_09580 [Anoxybacter fermentans]
MFKYLCPDLFIANILEIKPVYLKEMGVKGIICDLDNTIIPWDEEFLSEEMINWVISLKKDGIRFCLLSNSLHNRVNSIAQKLAIDAVPAAGKPRKKAFLKAIDKLQLSKEKILVVGDQLFTDILGGKRLGLKTILVKPMSEKEFFWTRFMRRLEKWVLDKLEYKGILGINDQD